MPKSPLPDHVKAALGEATELQLPPRGRHKLPKATKCLGVMQSSQGFDLELETANGAVLVLPMSFASAKVVYEVLDIVRRKRLESKKP